MESSLIPLPVAPAAPTLAGAAPPPAALADAAPTPDGGAAFASVLGAVNLTPDQQRALADLLAGLGLPGTLPTGKGLPPAATDLRPAETAEGATGAEGEQGPVALPPELAALLALLQPVQAADDPTPAPQGDGAAALPALVGRLRQAFGAALPGGSAPVAGRATRGPGPDAVAVPGTGQSLGASLSTLPTGSSATGETLARPADEILSLLRAGAGTGAADAAPPLLDADPADAARAPVGRPVADGAADPAASRPRVAETVAVPFGERGWERALGERVVWLVGHQIQAAEVKLNPPHLGPVEFRLTLNGNEASVSFTAAHAGVRDAIEQALPRLREMLSEQNLVVVNVDVGQRGDPGQAARRDAHPGAGSGGGFGTTPRDGEGVAAPMSRRTGASSLVDEYA